MDNLNSQFRNNICPRELNYNLDTACVDFSKLRYNSYYHSYEFYSAKFPRSWGDNPLFIPLIEALASQAKSNNITPLTELNNIANINNVPNTSE